jgi:hypothetical protein
MGRGILRGIDAAKVTGTLEPNYALPSRGWFATMCVTLTPHALFDLPSQPQIQENENDFSEVERKRDGSLTVHNSRFKTRIRMSTQVHRTWCCMTSCFTHPDILPRPA